MKEKLIHSYVTKLRKEDIVKFASDNNVSLTDQEVDILYTEIQNHWQQLLYNPDEVLKRVKGEVSPTTYEHIIYFYNLYSEKLRRFLSLY